MRMYISNPDTSICENGKYLSSSMDDSAIACHRIIEKETKTARTNFDEKKNAICKTKSFCILLAFLLITITLLIAVRI